MTVYRVDVRPSAQRALRTVRGPIRRRLEGVIVLLAQEPRPPAARRMTERDAWRVRVGDYRIVYEIHDEFLVIVVVALGHRREVYERWHGSPR